MLDPNIDFEVPLDVAYNDTTTRVILSSIPTTIKSTYKPIVDEMNWFLKEN